MDVFLLVCFPSPCNEGPQDKGHNWKGSNSDNEDLSGGWKTTSQGSHKTALPAHVDLTHEFLGRTPDKYDLVATCPKDRFSNPPRDDR